MKTLTAKDLHLRKGFSKMSNEYLLLRDTVPSGMRLKATKRMVAADVRETTEYRETPVTRLGFAVIKAVLGPLIRRVWVRSVEGLEHLPGEGAAIIAANHSSYLDFLTFEAISPRKVHYLAAEKFFTSPLWRPLMVLTGQIPVDRKKSDKTKSRGMVLSALDQGRLVGIYPEGSRSTSGRLQKAFTGVARFAHVSGAPVIPVGMIGSYPVWSRWQKYPRLAREIRIRIGQPVHFGIYPPSMRAEEMYRDMTDRVMLEIARLCGQTYIFTGRRD